jgi:exopolysaccharide biosynthesis polyprenyl glycosylphosphotransferase
MQSFWKSHFLTLCLVATDVIAFSLIWVGAWFIRRILDPYFSKPIDVFDTYQVALRGLLPIWIFVLVIFKQYTHKDRISSLNEVENIFKSGLVLLLATLAVAHLTKDLWDPGRAVIGISMAGQVVYLYASRSLLKIIKQRLRQKGLGLTRTAIIGAGETGRQVAHRILTHPEIGYNLVGFIDIRAEDLGREVDDVPVIGDGTDLVKLLLRYRVEEVFLAIPSLSQNDTFEMIVKCENAGVHFKIVKDDLLQVITDRVKIDVIGDFPVILLREGRLTPIALLTKRGLDLFMSTILIIMTAPLFILISILIKLDSPGPALFSHERVGKDGRVFSLFKFRTMVPDADPYSQAPADQADLRITRFGKFLRKTSLDELPQFFNVLRGEMSIVGPRPEMPFIVNQYKPWQRRRLDVPQGITGLWQIAGRKHIPLHFNLEYDFYYIRNWSLWLDLAILMRTIPAVIFGKGAF